MLGCQESLQKSHLSPGVPELEEYWLEKTMPNVEKDWNYYTRNTHHSQPDTQSIKVNNINITNDYVIIENNFEMSNAMNVLLTWTYSLGLKQGNLYLTF